MATIEKGPLTRALEQLGRDLMLLAIDALSDDPETMNSKLLALSTTAIELTVKSTVLECEIFLQKSHRRSIEELETGLSSLRRLK